MIWKAGDPVPKGFVLASDGLLARSQGIWAQDKLRFIKEYLPPAVGATKKKGGQTYYLDLFAGPGRNATVDDFGRVKADFPGSPIIALRAQFKFRGEDRPKGFGHFHFFNLDPLDHEMLERRVKKELAALGGRVNPEQVHLHHGDSNVLLPGVLARIPTWAYILAFVDIEGPSDLPFETLRTLRRSHPSTDAYILYPTGIGLDRLLPYDPVEREKYRPILDAYYGTEEWWDIVERRKTEAQSPQMKQQLLELYQSQLRKVWKNVHIMMRVEKGERGLYHMIFVTDHEVAEKIAKAAGRLSRQYDLLDELS